MSFEMSGAFFLNDNFLTDSKTTPLEIKILALQYSNLFQIGVIAQPTKNALEAYAIKKLPHFSGYVLEEVTSMT